MAVVVALVFIHANHARPQQRYLDVDCTDAQHVDRPGEPGGSLALWSLAVEVTFYLCLPVIMLVAVGRSDVALDPVLGVLVALFAISLWWHLDGAAYAGEHSAGQPSQWLPSYIGWFAIGIGLSLVSWR